MEKAQDESGTGGDALKSSKAKAQIIASDIDGARELSEGVDIYQRSIINRPEAEVGVERDESKRLYDIM